jgi:hypothetical protein
MSHRPASFDPDYDHQTRWHDDNVAQGHPSDPVWQASANHSNTHHRGVGYYNSSPAAWTGSHAIVNNEPVWGSSPQYRMAGTPGQHVYASKNHHENGVHRAQYRVSILLFAHYRSRESHRNSYSTSNRMIKMLISSTMQIQKCQTTMATAVTSLPVPSTTTINTPRMYTLPRAQPLHMDGSPILTCRLEWCVQKWMSIAHLLRGAAMRFMHRALMGSKAIMTRRTFTYTMGVSHTRKRNRSGVQNSIIPIMSGAALLPLPHTTLLSVMPYVPLSVSSIVHPYR